MIRYDLLLAFRSLRRRPGFTALNAIGLSIGLACALIAFALVQHELRFDAHHAQAERTYRVGALWPNWNEQGPSYQEQTPTALVPILRDGLPGVGRVVELRVGYGERSVQVGETFFSQGGRAFVDPDFFDVFDYAALSGSVDRLTLPNTVALTQTNAQRLFGDAEAVGQSLRYGPDRSFEVVAVLADPPAQTHLPFSFFVSLATLSPSYDEWGFSDGHSSYVVLEPGASAAAVERQLGVIQKTHQTPEEQASQQFVLQPLRSIHTDARYGAYPGGYVMNPQYLWGLGLIGVLILLSAAVNYVNLATAQGAARAREIGVRKAIGSTRGQLAMRLLAEAVLLSAGAAALGWAAALALLPLVADLFKIDVTRAILLSPQGLSFVAGVTFVVAGLAGFYPSIVLSRYEPATVLRRLGSSGQVGARGLRRGLVVFQFAAALALLLGALAVLQQMRYVEHKDLGFESQARVVVPTPDDEAGRARFREALERAPAVQSVTYAMGGPTKPGRLSHRYVWGDDLSGSGESLLTVPIDAEYTETFGINLLAGRTLRPEDEILPHSRAILVNQSMVQRMGFGSADEAIGATLYTHDEQTPLEVVGVTEDFHHASLRSQIAPAVLLYWPRWTHQAGVALAPDDVAAGLAQTQDAFAQVFPEAHFRYTFVDDYLGTLYEPERMIASAFQMFTLLALLVACLGLFGLAALTAAQRSKEVGVRKALGASVASIVALLSREVVGLAAIASVVSIVPVLLLVNRWLDGFAYHVSPGVGTGLAALTLVLIVALATVGWHALSAARVSPVDVLRGE